MTSTQTGTATGTRSATQPGRRERKKAATRKAISDAATALFVERGFDHVSTKEVADAADVSPTTVFAHFPTKETLVFDEDEKQRDELLSAVRDRPEGTGVLEALRGEFDSVLREQEGFPSETRAQFRQMIAETPALSEYWKRMWMRYGDDLAELLATEAGMDAPNPEITAFSHLALQAYLLTADADEPETVLNAGFDLLAPGWEAYAATAGLN